MQRISLDALATQQLELAAAHGGRPAADTVVGGHERVLRQTGFDFVATGHDVQLAREIEYKLREELAKRREDRNIIDDFRVF